MLLRKCCVTLLLVCGMFSAGSPSAAPDLEAIPLNRIVVKFKDDSGVQLQGQALALQAEAPAMRQRGFNAARTLGELRNVENLAGTHKLPIRRLFNHTRSALVPVPFAADEPSARPHGDLGSYYSLPLNPHWRWSRAEKLVARLKQLAVVETAYIEPMPVLTSVSEPGASSSDTPSFQSLQGYLNPGANGIDALYAWTQAGGAGNGVKVIDIEYSMDTDHEDLPALFIGIGTDSGTYEYHGTAVMGVMGAVNNGFGVTGIAHEAQFGFISQQSTSIANAIIQAADAVGRGGVVVLELQHYSAVTPTCACGGTSCPGYVPAEFYQAEYDAIRYATAQGVTVVQAAGNGYVNLDDPAYAALYGLDSREDSGAIMVGAASDYRREPLCFSNHGSYVDLHGWGTGVTTTGYGNHYNPGPSPEGYSRDYTRFFNGTSSATPIVAGAVAALQGHALASTGDYLTPAQVKALLRDTGTPQTYALNRAIGPLPNLRSALRRFNGEAPATVNTSMYFRGTPGNWAPQAMTAVYDNVWEIVVAFGGEANPRFKFDTYGDWTRAYGDTNNDAIVDLSGADITVAGNTQYRIRYYELTGLYTVEFFDGPQVDSVVVDWHSSALADQPLAAAEGDNWTATFAGTGSSEGFTINITVDGEIQRYFDADNDGILDESSRSDEVFSGTEVGVNYVLNVDPYTLAYSLQAQTQNQWRRTVVFIYGETVSGQDMFIRGGIDHNYAASQLGRNCTSSNFECAIPIRHRNLRNTTTNAWKNGDNYLDWYGVEPTQSGAQGSPLDWTTNLWPASWGAKRTVDVDGFGETPLNRWGAHYWMLDVDMDCSATANGWFELKSFISNGPGWEANVTQPGAPWSSGNHFAECGKLNVFRRGQSAPVAIETLP